MLRKASIIHGTDGSPRDIAWQSWLKNELEGKGCKVWFPQLPECHAPNVEVYDQFFTDSEWDFADNLIVGHSSGATATLHLLNRADFPQVKAVVLVATFLNERLLKGVSWYEPGQFKKLFVEEFDVEKIKNKAQKFYFVHGDDDPYCDYEEAKKLCEKLGGTFLTIRGGGHIAKTSGITELPTLIEALRRDGLI